MKTIKIILGLLFAFSVLASAQQVRFGVMGGANISAPSENYDNRGGFHVGATAEMEAPFVGKGFFFDAALMLTQKSMKNSYGIGEYGISDSEILNVKQTLTPSYLQLPVHFGYKFAVANLAALFVKGGPYMALGLFGNNKLKWADSDGLKGDLSEGVFKNTMNRFDWGLGFRVGAELLEHWQISVGHDWGLKSFEKHGGDAKHRTFTVSIGYKF